MREVVETRTGEHVTFNNAHGIIGHVAQPVVDVNYGRNDFRLPFERHGMVSVNVMLLEAHEVAGKRVVLFVIEE